MCIHCTGIFFAYVSYLLLWVYNYIKFNFCSERNVVKCRMQAKSTRIGSIFGFWRITHAHILPENYGQYINTNILRHRQKVRNSWIKVN